MSFFRQPSPGEKVREGAEYAALSRDSHSFEDSSREASKSPLLEDYEGAISEERARERGSIKRVVCGIATMGSIILMLWLAQFILASAPCDTPERGYQCSPEISHFWGQYSPYFSVPSNISAKTPPQCDVTFAQILSRHGARDPTASKTAVYNNTILKIQSVVKNFTGDFAFLADYEYTLGADQLTAFGDQQMVSSGIKFFNRYHALAANNTPFVRSAGENRVVQSAEDWIEGFQKAKGSAANISVLSIPEDEGQNNTLNHEICTNFEDGPVSEIGGEAQLIWMDVFIPPIQSRLNSALPGANLSQSEVIYMMDLCSFNTVASPNGTISPFCDLFTEEEWHQYDYFESIGKYYGYGPGNPLGPTQGVGFSNELIARLTDTAVDDHTSTNSTLDSSNTTFPLGLPLYADFSHDNDMTAIMSALGLFNSTKPLSNTSIETTEQTNGYSAAWTAPFAARVYVEKLSCDGSDEEFVRVLVNDRVMPLETCGGDKYGRCSLSAFVGSLTFVQDDGNWGACFTS